MIEAPMSVNIGLGAPVLPGVKTVGGCVFDSCLGQAAFGGIAVKNPEAALKAMALDAATAKGEIGGELGRVNFRIKEASYIDKVTNQQVIQNTLVSEDFGGKTISDVTDHGQHNTGTRQEYRRIIDRANLISQTEGDASIFWVSPGSESNGTAHRASLLIKHGDEVVEYWFSLTGSRNSLARMMKKLGCQDERKNESLEDQTIIRKGEDLHLTRQEIFHAHVNSLTKDEETASKQFIAKLRQEVALPDEVLEKRLQSSQKHYEVEIKKRQEVYKKDIKQALESIAVGFIGLPEFTIQPESHGAVNIKQERLVSDIVSVVPAMIFIADKINANGQITKDILTLQRHSKEESLQLISTVSNILTMGLWMDDSPKKDQVMFENNSLAESVTKLGKVLFFTESSPNLRDLRDFTERKDEHQLISYNLQNAEFTDLADSQRIEEGQDQNISVAALLEDRMEIYPSVDLSKKQGKEKIDLDSQAILVSIARVYKEMVNEILQKKGIEDLSIQTLEYQAVVVGKKMLTALFSEYDEIPEILLDGYSRLLFLVFAYNEKETPSEFKQLLAAFIYLEIKKIYTKKEQVQFAGFSLLENQIKQILTKGTLFEEILELITFEKLPNMAIIKKGKQTKKIPKSGIIYHRMSLVIYQYRPLVIKA